MKPLSKIVKLPSPEGGLRAVAARAPRVQALAVSWIERLRPAASRIYTLRRKIATALVVVLAGLLVVHVTFGANGMVIYKQKRAEYQGLKKQIGHVQQDNDRYAQQIQGLKTDEKAIEKEARTQMGYAKPGEIVYVTQKPKAEPAVNHTAKK